MPTETYDYLIIGTGLVETALSSILSTDPTVKILHIDTNSIYGNDFSTYNFTQLVDHFESSSKNDEKTDILVNELCTKNNRLFNIDLTPKLLLQDSPMKDFLLDNKIHEIVTFTSIKGSYLFTDKLHSIPTTEAQSLKSSVVGFMQKCRVVKFFWNIRQYYDNKEKSTKPTMLEEFRSFGLS